MPKAGDFKASIYTRIATLTKVRFEKLKSIVDTFSEKTPPLSELDLKQLNGFLNEAKKKKLDFDNSLQKAIMLPDDDVIEDDVLASDQDTIEEAYTHITATIEVLLPPEPPKTPSVVSDTSSLHLPSSSAVRLPKLDLPKFSGNSLEWTSFISMFDTAVHRNVNLSSVAKFQYLLSVLQNEALNLVKGLALTTPNYLVAYNLLRDRYHNTRRLQTLHLNQLLDLPDIHSTSMKGVRHFVNVFNEHSQALKALDCDVSQNNPLLSALLLRKLDTTLRKSFESTRTTVHDDSQSHTLPETADIIKFLSLECAQNEDANLHGASSSFKSANNRTFTKPVTKKGVRFHTGDVSMISTTQRSSFHDTNSSNATCFDCNQPGHPTRECSRFLSKTPRERYQLVIAVQRCINCLGNHPLKNCSSSFLCKTCRQPHHSLLHFESNPRHQGSRPSPPIQGHQGQRQSHQGQPRYRQDQQGSRPQPFQGHQHQSNSGSNRQTTSQNRSTHHQDKVTNDPPSATTLSTATCSAQHSTVLLGTTLVKLTTSQGISHVFRALLDTGSMVELISERAANLLNCNRFSSNVRISGLAQHASSTKGSTNLHLSTLAGRPLTHNHTFQIIDKISVDLPRTQISHEVLERVKPYTLADPSFHLPGGIDVLIGSSLLPMIYTQESYSLGHRMPHVIGTHFGFILMGQAPCAHDGDYTANFTISLLSTTDNILHSAIQRFWQQEELPTVSLKSVEEQQCDDHFNQTHSRDSTGRYIVRLPLKTDPSNLGNSKTTAEKRFHSLEAKLKTQPHFAELYRNFMTEYLDLGHMKKLKTLNNVPHYFLPHHGVLKTTNDATKLRTVFDASCVTSSGRSLNDILFTGRKLQTDISDVIFNFRSHSIVFSCDIKQMYRQILVHPDDQKLQLILWRNSPSEELSTFQLTTVTYGMNSSPYLAIKTLQQLATDEGSSFPLAAYSLRHHTYVDDIVTGADSIEEALQLQDQLIQLLQRGGFELRKWASNSPELLQKLPAEHLETPGFLLEAQLPQFSILGLHWSPTEDCFRYEFTTSSNSHTKRAILSVIAKLYDPCGFLSPMIMLAKCIMQLLWTQGLNWDEQLPRNIIDKWETFLQDTQTSLSKIKISRALPLSHSNSIELHGFSDASELGYAAVIYLRCESSTGQVTIHQLISKTRVAPLKKVTLPRLELCGAHLLSKLMSYCINQFPQYTIDDTVLWCDSSVVLTWLQTPPYKLKTYVANRVAQVQELFSPILWRHIKGTDNPADCASRGILTSALIDHPLWWHGPSWLQHSRPLWPKPVFTPIELDTSDEVKVTPLNVLTVTSSEEWDLLVKFSSLSKLFRVCAYILRFVNNCKTLNRLSGHLSLSELKGAEKTIFRLIQASSFHEDLQLLESGAIPTAKLRKLTPFVDPDGLLRVGGRLSHSHLSHDIKHPIVLPKQHHVVNILIDYYHISHLHAGPQLLQSLLSQKFWILSARSVIRSRIFKCLPCFRAKPHNQSPLMGDLPSHRITPARPFLSTGIDYAGPFNVRVHNLKALRQIKVYLSIFICMVTKAVHIEVVTDLSTEGFIAALTRFISRRGLCSHIYSDCGTNFVGANTMLRKIVQTNILSSASQKKLLSFSIDKNITFHFNPPAAPHQGGLWESAVKSAKYHFKRVIGDTVLTLSQFQTLSVQVEAMLNSRPLTPLSTDPSEDGALTPGHFLVGTPLAALPEPSLQDLPINRLRHWQLVQAFNQRIWRRWQLEYLHSLQQRSKWTAPQPNLKVGTLVLLHMPTPPLTWPLGRIVATHPGADGTVRVVQVKTATGTFTRPAVKVFPLPSD